MGAVEVHESLGHGPAGEVRGEHAVSADRGGVVLADRAARRPAAACVAVFWLRRIVQLRRRRNRPLGCGEFRLVRVHLAVHFVRGDDDLLAAAGRVV